MAKKKQIRKLKKESPEGIAVPAGLFVGMGVGFLTNNFVAWLFIGLGAGFLLLMILRLIKRK